MKLLNWLCPKKKYTIEVFKDEAGFWRHRIRHANGNIIESSEAYSAKGECLDTVIGLSKAARFPVKVEG